MEEVVLYDGGLSQGTSSYAAISFTEQGDLRLSAQDVGDGPRESWGDSDYEWWVTVRATETPRLLALLRDQVTLLPVERDDLLWLIREKFRGRSSAASEFREWLELNGIPYEFFSYV
jgi:hypothetical protein